MHSLLLLTEEQELFKEDYAVVRLTLTPYVTEEYPVVRVTLTPSYTEEYTRFDATEVYLDLQASGTEFQQPLIPWFDPPPDAKVNWWVKDGNKWRGEVTTRFTLSVRGRL